MKISIKKTPGEFNIGDVVPGVGIVLQVYEQGDQHVLVCDHGNFESEKKEQPKVERPKVEKLQVAEQKGSKKILDQSPSPKDKNKKILRG